MDFNASFEALKNRIAGAAQAAARATKSAATVTKANINILSEQEKLKKAYMELGKLYYRDYITGEEPDDAEYIPLCDNITELTKAIDGLKSTVEDIRSKAKEEPADLEAELENLNKDLDDQTENLQDLKDAKPEEAVFEVVDDEPKD